MSLFRFLWLRRFIRKNTRPIPLNKAGTWKKRLAFAYMIIGWNAFGLVCYSIYTGKLDWAKYHGLKTDDDIPAGQSWAKALSLSKVHVYSYSGISSKGEYSVEDGEIVEKKMITE